MKFSHKENSGFYSWVYGVGSEEEMKKFNATIKFFDLFDGEEIMSRGPVVSIEKSAEEIVEEDQVLFFSDKRSKRLMNFGTVRFDVQVVERQ